MQPMTLATASMLLVALGTATMLLVELATAGALSESSGYENLGSNESSYRLHTQRTTWDVAFTICQMERAHLVVIDSPAEGNAVKKLFQRVLPFHPPLTWQFDLLHVGITNKGPKGIWFGLVGGPVDKSGYNVWKSGLPNNKRNTTEHCGAIARNGEYHHLRCDDKENPLPFICEK